MPCLRKAALLLATTFFLSFQLHAQVSVGVHVAGLTSAERDTLVHGLAAGQGLQLTYACVPAGILVFTSTAPGASRASLRTNVTEAISPVIAAARIGTEELDQLAAEAACRNAREE